jgi:hypothetical protein
VKESGKSGRIPQQTKVTGEKPRAKRNKKKNTKFWRRISEPYEVFINSVADPNVFKVPDPTSV